MRKFMRCLVGEELFTVSKKLLGDCYLPGRCFHNAEHYAHVSGGKIVYGWVFTNYGEWISANVHAVVELPDGNLVDCTPPFFVGTVLFYKAKYEMNLESNQIPSTLWYNKEADRILTRDMIPERWGIIDSGIKIEIDTFSQTVKNYHIENPLFHPDRYTRVNDAGIERYIRNEDLILFHSGQMRLAKT